MTFTAFLIVLAFVLATAIIFYFIGRNNPNLSAVNKLLAIKKWVYDTTGAIKKAL